MERDNIDQLIAQERERQDAKWGVQNHSDGTGKEFLPASLIAKGICEEAAKMNVLTWHDVLREEFFEAISETDPVKLKEELIQCAAVIKAWVECIDRREVK